MTEIKYSCNTKQCQNCNKSFFYEAPTECGICFTKKREEKFNELNIEIEKFYEMGIKKSTYYFLFYISPLIFIWAYFGLKYALITEFFNIYFFSLHKKLVDFFDRIF